MGPVLAAQMGYSAWHAVAAGGVVLAGAVQDFMVLFISSRRNGASLGVMIKEEMWTSTGDYRAVWLFLNHIIILAVPR
ncbi:hypothetical protein OHD50_11070 [Escherichia coli]|nr:hypothetical protein [Escherichia coli]